MESATVQYTIDAKTNSFVNSFKKLERDVKIYVYEFLLTAERNCLFVDTMMTGEVNILVYQCLRKLKRQHYKRNKLIDNYLGMDNQNFIDWYQLLEAMGKTNIMPEFRNLLVCEVPSTVDLKEYADVLESLIFKLKTEVFKKCILIAPGCDTLDRFLLSAVY